jgi:penicillin-binding protein 1C
MSRGRWLLVPALLLAVPVCLSAPLPEFAQVRSAHIRSDVQLLDRHGELLHELRVNASVRRLAWVPITDISPALVRAVVQAEDRRFFDHHGVDWTAISAAAVRSLWSDNPRGASTLTMQLAGWINPDLRPDGGRRSLSQKWQQIQAARTLEEQWTKPEILEAYLNLVYFRGELQGIDAAARGLFDKQSSGLSEAEALVLAALLRAPSATLDVVARRACHLGKDLDWSVSCPVIEATAREHLTGPFRVRAAASDAPHVARALLRRGTPRVVSTLDAGVQRFAQNALIHQLDTLSAEHVRDGAVLVVDNRSGEVLAYVGNASNGFVDGIMAPRQAGSTLKPFLYEIAIAQRLLTAASILKDAPVNLVTPTGLYVPQNYDNDFKGPVSLRTALGNSLNVPAVRTLMLVGTESFVSQLRRLGFSLLTESGDYYGYSLALGSAEVNLWQLVNGYRTLANGGSFSPMTLTAEPKVRRQQILDRDASYIVSDILADRSARGLTFGLENVLAPPFWSAVKTGTSKDMRDNWCVGYSDRYTIGVWVGNFNGSPMQDVSGVTGAAPVWLEVMRYLHHGQPATPPRPSRGVVAGEIRYSPAIETPRREWFLRGTETAEVQLPDRAEPQIARIAYPARGAILAMDPDIPEGHQRVFFEVTPPDNNYRILVDGRVASVAEDGWQPEPGRHRAILLGRDGLMLDESVFEVRGSRNEP